VYQHVHLNEYKRKVQNASDEMKREGSELHSANPHYLRDLQVIINNETQERRRHQREEKARLATTQRRFRSKSQMAGPNRLAPVMTRPLNPVRTHHSKVENWGERGERFVVDSDKGWVTIAPQSVMKPVSRGIKTAQRKIRAHMRNSCQSLAHAVARENADGHSKLPRISMSAGRSYLMAHGVEYGEGDTDMWPRHVLHPPRAEAIVPDPFIPPRGMEFAYHGDRQLKVLQDELRCHRGFPNPSGKVGVYPRSDQDPEETYFSSARKAGPELALLNSGGALRLDRIGTEPDTRSMNPIGKRHMRQKASIVGCTACEWQGSHHVWETVHRNMCTGLNGWVRDVTDARDYRIVKGRLHAYEAACKIQSAYRRHLAESVVALALQVKAGMANRLQKWWSKMIPKVRKKRSKNKKRWGKAKIVSVGLRAFKDEIAPMLEAAIKIQRVYKARHSYRGASATAIQKLQRRIVARQAITRTIAYRFIEKNLRRWIVNCRLRRRKKAALRLEAWWLKSEDRLNRNEQRRQLKEAILAQLVQHRQKWTIKWHALKSVSSTVQFCQRRFRARLAARQKRAEDDKRLRWEAGMAITKAVRGFLGRKKAKARHHAQVFQRALRTCLEPRGDNSLIVDVIFLNVFSGSTYNTFSGKKLLCIITLIVFIIYRSPRSTRPRTCPSPRGVPDPNPSQGSKEPMGNDATVSKSTRQGQDCGSFRQGESNISIIQYARPPNSPTLLPPTAHCH